MKSEGEDLSSTSSDDEETISNHKEGLIDVFVDDCKALTESVSSLKKANPVVARLLGLWHSASASDHDNGVEGCYRVRQRLRSPLHLQPPTEEKCQAVRYTP